MKKPVQDGEEDEDVSSTTSYTLLAFSCLQRKAVLRTAAVRATAAVAVVKIRQRKSNAVRAYGPTHSAQGWIELHMEAAVAASLHSMRTVALKANCILNRCRSKSEAGAPPSSDSASVTMLNLSRRLLISGHRVRLY